MSSLIQALSNRTPIVWVNTLEPERVISSVPELLSDDRPIFVYDAFDGLTQWDRKTSSWKIVLIEVTNPLTSAINDEPIYGEQQALNHVLRLDDPSLYIMRNAHKSIDDFITLYSVLYNRFRHTFFEDDLDKLPTQIIAFGGEDHPPAEIIQMTTVIKWGLPGPAELGTIITNIVQHYGRHIIDENGVEPLVRSSIGLSEHAAIETYLSSIRTNGRIDGAVLKKLRLERLKSMTNLEVGPPHFTLAQVGGLDNAKKLIHRIQWIWENPELAAKYNLSPLRRVLLLGLPGCGKSMLCEAAASALGLELAKAGVAGGHVMDKFVGQSEKNIVSMFAQINAMSPIAVWIDELGRDLAGGASSDVSDAGTTARVHSTFLTQLQELSDGVFLFAAANNIDALPPEMLRADRFDKLYFVGFPTLEERAEIFPVYLPPDVDFNVEQLAARTSCFTGAEIKALVSFTASEVVPIYQRQITTQDILAAIPHQKNRIWVRHRHLAVNMYQRSYSDYEWASTAQHADAADIIQGREPNAATRTTPIGQVTLK